MVYTSKSVYKYITGDDLEAFAVLTYLSFNTRYTETVVMAKVTIAERIINEICKQSFTSPIPDGVVVATTLMAERLMHNQMVNDGKVREGSEKVKEFVDYIVDLVLKKHKTSSDIGIDSIPMSGANRSGQSIDYY